MLLCYIDESGDEQQLRTPSDPPVLALGGLVVDHERAKSLIWDFLQIKKRFNPTLAEPGVKLSDVIRFEVKGSDIRKDVRSGSRRRRRRAYGFLDDVLRLLESTSVTILAEVHVKGATPLSRWVYSDAVAAMAAQFEAQLRAAEVPGMMILDAHTKHKNVPSVHHVTTKRFKTGGDAFPHLLEAPLFGHSDSHVVLQIADILVSALQFPMACAAYSSSLIHNIHLNDEFSSLRARYGTRLQLLEHRYLDADGRRAGGVRVIDHLNRQPSLALFRDVPYNFTAL
ncbi:DUF3800 domain-containing protein [Williamsia serinedens]|uniref:DUF3800 domain-containing protein n=1 Tax=Williamsia serinedens TaxID=391736 RepID=A0ABT1GZ10_9NOCA|nr:DUF3800 domain-containing protein [Williamsia serinedens]MCP2160232.1 Protein of unknown function (DUF3800) [Williamsia serinedens]